MKTAVQMAKPTFRPYQLEARRNFLSDTGNALIQLPTGTGKCLGIGTPILMHDGTVKPVENVAVGDLLMGPDSQPRLVVSLARGRENLYRVVPTRGDPFVVNESHILSLKMTPGSSKGSGRRGGVFTPGNLVNVSVADYLTQSKTFKHCAKGWRTGVDFPHADVPLDPYYLGIWLADGSKDNPVVYKPDDEVRRACQQVADAHGCQLVTYSPDRCPGWSITGGERYEFKSNPVRTKLAEIGVLGDKHVPRTYKVNSRSVRLELLAGILDGDGSLVNDGCSYDFIAKNESFSRDVAYLARSLGLAATVKECQKSCQGGFSGTYWRVCVSGHTDEIPCRIPRKIAAPRRQKKDVLKFGFSLEPIGEGDYYGFTLEGPDRLFLLGDFTVTHNTLTAVGICDEYPGERVLFLAPTGTLVYQTCHAFLRCGVWPNVEKADEYKGGLYLPDAREWKDMFPDGRPPNESFVFNRAWVSTIQTFVDRVDKYREDPFDLIVCDEAHRSLAGSWMKTVGRLLQFNPRARVLGLTATPSRGDKQSLAKLYPGEVTAEGVQPKFAFRMPITEGIDQGWLVDIVCERASIAGVDESMWKMGASKGGGRDITDGSLSKSMNNKVSIESIAHEVIERSEGRKGILFLPGVAVTESVSDAINAIRPGCSTFIHGNVRPKRDNRRRVRMIKDGKVQFVCGCDALIEGFDVPDIALVVMARFTAQRGRYEQMLGRGLRVIAKCIEGKHTADERKAAIAASSKSNVKVLDFANSSRFRLVSVEDVLLDPTGDSKRSKKASEYVKKHRDQADKRAMREQLEILDAMMAFDDALRKNGGPPRKADFFYERVDLLSKGGVTQRQDMGRKTDARRPTGEMLRQAEDFFIRNSESMTQGQLAAEIARKKDRDVGRKNFGFLTRVCGLSKDQIEAAGLNWHDATYLRNLLKASGRDRLPDGWQDMVARKRRERAAGGPRG